MLFSRKTIYILPNVYFHNDTLKWIDQIKYLGVTIDNKLSFTTHLNSIKNKISRGTGIIYSLIVYFLQSILLKLYFSITYPYLTQNIILWGGVSENKLRLIQIQMNKALRHIFNIINFYHRYKPLMATNDMYKTLNLLKIKDVYQFFHSYIYGTHFQIFENHFIKY